MKCSRFKCFGLTVYISNLASKKNIVAKITQACFILHNFASQETVFCFNYDIFLLENKTNVFVVQNKVAGLSKLV